MVTLRCKIRRFIHQTDERDVMQMVSIWFTLHLFFPLKKRKNSADAFLMFEMFWVEPDEKWINQKIVFRFSLLSIFSVSIVAKDLLTMKKNWTSRAAKNLTYFLPFWFDYNNSVGASASNPRYDLSNEAEVKAAGNWARLWNTFWRYFGNFYLFVLWV